MKQLTSTFFLSIISVFSFAQTPFTEQLFLDNAKKMEKDPVQALKSNAVSDYVFVGTGGFITDLKGLIALYDNFTPVSFTPTDYKIRTYGNSAIVTGRLKHSYTNKKTGAPRILDELITYTYAWINGEWKLTSSQHSEAPIDRKIEEAAIKKHLDDVDAAFNSGDKDGVINAWKNDPQISFIGSGAGGEFNLIAQDFEGLKKAVTQYVVKPTGTKGIKSNHRFIFKGNLAIVEFDQEDIRANGTKGYAHNINILEKTGDSWKAIVASHHSFNPKNEEKPEEVVKQWVSEYNKDAKAFFMDRCTEDFVAISPADGHIFGKEFVNNVKEGSKPDSEVSDMKSFRSGNMAVVVGNHIWHHKQADGTDKPDKVAFTYTMMKKNGRWMYMTSQHNTVVTKEDNPEDIVKQWIADYNKDGKSFFENNCSDDYIASNTGINGGKFFDRATIVGRARKENETNDAETTNMKSFKSGNLAVVMGNLIWHHKQPDGSDKPDKTVSTFIMQKKDGKWWYVGHHISPLKE